MAFSPFRSRPLERQRLAGLQRSPLRSEVVEPVLELRRELLRAPGLVELPSELLGASAVREPRPLDPLLAPQPRGEPLIERLEDSRIPSRGKIAEDAAVEPVLGLGYEVKKVVR